MTAITGQHFTKSFDDAHVVPKGSRAVDEAHTAVRAELADLVSHGITTTLDATSLRLEESP